MLVNVDNNKCVGCNACIRTCPVLEANEAVMSEDGTHTVIRVNKDKCISCGECIKSCAHGARTYIDDTERFFKAVKGKADIAVIVDPAFRITEPDAEAMLAELRMQGIKIIYDASFGADICTYMQMRALKEKKVRKIVSQPCAVVTEYILKHRHDLIPSLSPIHSPIACTAIYLRNYLGFKGEIACISPCIAKRLEFEETGLVQFNVTFKRFAEHMNNDFNYDKNAVFKFDSPDCYDGKIYSKPRGLSECMLNAMPELDVRGFEGKDIYKELDYYYDAKEGERPAVYDVLACENGCISGSGVEFKEKDVFRYISRLSRIGTEAFSEREKQKTGFPKTDKQFQLFEKKLRYQDFVREYSPKEIKEKLVTEQDLKAAFAQLMKSSHDEQHYNCGSCGYDSCEKMALALAKEINVPQNCRQYLLRQTELAAEEVVRAKEEVKSRNAYVADTVAGISGNIEKICESTAYIEKSSENNAVGMADVHSKLDMLHGKCEEINEAVAGIIKVTDMYHKMADSIRTITDQTHILSINASVEASRAGAAGKSFAVVAGEIRSLAANTKSTTAVVDENDELVKSETARVLKIASEIEGAVKTLDGVMLAVDKNVADTTATGSVIEQAAGEIKNSADELYAVSNRS